MEQREPDWKKLCALTQNWLNQAYSKVQKALPEMTAEESHVGFAASFCLLSCYDYMATAFDAFEKGRFYAGLACCRPVAETAITFRANTSTSLSHRSYLFFFFGFTAGFSAVAITPLAFSSSVACDSDFVPSFNSSIMFEISLRNQTYSIGQEVIRTTS